MRVNKICTGQNATANLFSLFSNKVEIYQIG